MSSINFYLDKPDRKNYYSIFLFYNLNGQRLKYFTKEKILEKSWNTDKQCVKKNHVGEEINTILDDLREFKQ